MNEAATGNKEVPQEEVENADAYRQAAKRMHHKDGEVEIDPGAPISAGADDGVYVQAWVWVYHADIEGD